MFKKQHYLQIDETVQDLHMSCSYNDIAMYSCDLIKALRYVTAVKYWKRFRDDVFVLPEHSRVD